MRAYRIATYILILNAYSISPSEFGDLTAKAPASEVNGGLDYFTNRKDSISLHNIKKICSLREIFISFI